MNNSSAVFTADISRYVGSSYLSIVLVVGGCLNVLMLISSGFAFSKLKPYHYLIINLIFADVLFVFTQIPLEWYGILYGVWPFDPVSCTVFFIFGMILHAVTFITHAFIAVNRLVGCIMSFSRKAEFLVSGVGTTITICFIWLWCTAYAMLPIVTKYVTVSFDSILGITDVSPEIGIRAFYFWMYMGTLGAWIPLVTIIINYTVICISIRRSGQLFSSPILKRNFIKATKYMFSLTFVFFILWLPSTVQTLFDMSIGTSALTFRACYYVLHVRVLVNPIVYTLKIPEFRKGLYAVFASAENEDDKQGPAKPCRDVITKQTKETVVKATNQSQSSSNVSGDIPTAHSSKNVAEYM